MHLLLECVCVFDVWIMESPDIVLVLVVHRGRFFRLYANSLQAQALKEGKAEVVYQKQ